MTNLIWKRYIAPAQHRWFLPDRIPTVGEVRGKATLFRRFGTTGDGSKGTGWNPKTFGFDASWWKYNTPEDDHERFNVQDWFDFNSPKDIRTKIKYIDDQIQRAVAFNSTTSASLPDTAKLFLNFCSESNFFNPLCWPQPIALQVNRTIESVSPTMGLIILDYAEFENWIVPKRLVDTSLRSFGRDI